MIQSILIATDGSEAAHSAERLGIAFAARLKARLAVLSVIEERVSLGLRADALGIPPGPVAAAEAFLKVRAEAALKRVADAARAKDCECTTDLARGIADDRIVERGQSAQLTVLGRDGDHAQARTVLIGSTVDGVLRKTRKSALVVPSGAELGGPVVLAFDGSPGSRAAARIAVDLAQRFGQGIHVFVDSKDKGRATARFDEVRRLLGGAQVPVRESNSTLGRPDVKVVDLAKSARAGLIVMGAIGRNRISDYFVGSNASAVVRSSPVAVLLAR
jgi:nucleotide-binding universal stress UspA family protein